VDEIVLVAVTLFLRQGFFFWDRVWGEGWQGEGGELQKYAICDNVLRPVARL